MGDGSPHRRGLTGLGDGESRPGGSRCLKSACGDGSPHWRGPTSWGDGESRPDGGRCLKSGYWGRQPPTGAAPPGEGLGSRAQAVVVA